MYTTNAINKELTLRDILIQKCCYRVWFVLCDEDKQLYGVTRFLLH